jgi:hypothetical protein
MSSILFQNCLLLRKQFPIQRTILNRFEDVLRLNIFRHLLVAVDAIMLQNFYPRPDRLGISQALWPVRKTGRLLLG